MDRRDGITTKITQAEAPRIGDSPKIYPRNKKPNQDQLHMHPDYSEFNYESQSYDVSSHNNRERERKRTSNRESVEHAHVHTGHSHGGKRGSQRTVPMSESSSHQNGRSENQRPSSAGIQSRDQRDAEEKARLQEKLRTKRNKAKETRANEPTGPPSDHAQVKRSQNSGGNKKYENRGVVEPRESNHSDLQSINTENHSEIISNNSNIHQKMQPKTPMVPLKSPSNSELMGKNTTQRYPKSPEVQFIAAGHPPKREQPQKNNSQGNNPKGRSNSNNPQRTNSKHSNSQISSTNQKSSPSKPIPAKPTYNQVESKIKSLIKKDKEQFVFSKKGNPEMVEFLTEDDINNNSNYGMKIPQEDCTFRTFENKDIRPQENGELSRNNQLSGGNTLEISRDDSRSSISSSHKLLGGNKKNEYNTSWRNSKESGANSKKNEGNLGVMDIASNLLKSDILKHFHSSNVSKSETPLKKPQESKVQRKEKWDHQEPKDPFTNQKIASVRQRPIEEAPNILYDEDDQGSNFLHKQQPNKPNKWIRNVSETEIVEPASTNYMSAYKKQSSLIEESSFEYGGQQDHRLKDNLINKGQEKQDINKNRNYYDVKRVPHEEDEDHMDSGNRFADAYVRKEKFNKEDYELNFNDTSRVSSSQFSAFCPNEEMKSFFKKEFVENNSITNNSGPGGNVGSLPRERPDFVDMTNNSSHLTYGLNSMYLEKKNSGRTNKKED